MSTFSLVFVNLMRNKVRTALTLLSVVVALFLFCSLQGVLDTLNDAIQVGSETKLVVRNKISLVFPLPLSYLERLKTTPDVDVRAKTQEITQTARAVVEQKLGLKLRRLYIHLHHSANPRNAPLPPLMPEPLQTVKLESLQPLARSMSPEPAPRGMLPEPLVAAADATPERPAEK